MSPAAYVVVMCIAWIVLIAVVVSLFHAQRWIDKTIDEELNATFTTHHREDRNGY